LKHNRIQEAVATWLATVRETVATWRLRVAYFGSPRSLPLLVSYRLIVKACAATIKAVNVP